MSKENRVLLACLIGACVLPLVVGGLLGWPTWITAPLFAAVLVGSYRKFTHGTRTATGHVGALLDRIGLHPDNPVRDLTAHRLANLIEASGNARVAEEVRRKFDAPR